MQKEKGQIQIILFILVIIGVVLFFNRDKGIFNFTSPAIAPSQEIAAPPQEESLPAPVPPSSPAVDYAAPYRFNLAPTQGLSSATRQTTISLETNEKAVCRYSTVSGVAYDAMQYAFSSAPSTFHSASVTGLSEGRAYSYFIKCLDQSGNKNTDDYIITFWVENPADFTPPVLSHAYPSGDVFPANTSEVTVGVSTDEPAFCRYSVGQGIAYDSMGGELSPVDGTKKYHTARITGLVAGSYDYFVRCRDLSDNVNTGDVMISFEIAP